MLSPASRLRVHSALFTVALLFSANYLVSKLGMREFSPLTFAWLRVVGAAGLLWFVARGQSLPRESSRRVALFAILGVVINQTMFLSGLAFTTVQVAAILITSIPVFAVGAAIAMGRERASASRIGGIALAGAGALLVVGGEGFHGTLRSLIGALMILTNCLSYALYLVISKPDMAHLSPRAVVARMFAVGTLLMFPIAAVPLWREDWAAISPQAWLALALVILGPTVAAYLLQAWALRHADSSVVAAYTYLQPVLATVLGAVFLGEHIRPIVVVAGTMIFAGVWLTGRKM
ncbi:MAG: DMT family transporter [Thermoanaerobaculia bacterium]